MAKAQFHKNQRVYVKTVGTWAIVERVVPQWAKGLDEPIRIHYDVGLGRDFGADELQSEQPASTAFDPTNAPWRVVRARNKWQSPQDCGHHPHPGTYPLIVTGETDWGGWRVPAAEYDLDPHKVEAQARLIAAAPKLYGFATSFLAAATSDIDALPDEVVQIAREASKLIKAINSESDPLD